MDQRTDWREWHAPYDDPASPLSRRLAIVQGAVHEWLDSAGSGMRVLSACAGDGRDVLAVLSARRPEPFPSVTLLELDARLAERARDAARSADLAPVTVSCVDAGSSDSYVGAVPADLVLLCGIFGNISDSDVEGFVRATPQLCNTGATVIWTRHTRPPDLTPHIRAWFERAGFEERSFFAPDEHAFSVGVCTYVGQPKALQRGVRLFTFVR